MRADLVADAFVWLAVATTILGGLCLMGAIVWIVGPRVTDRIARVVFR